MVRRVLFSRVTKQSRKGILPFSSISLVNWMLVYILFVQVFVEFIDFVFVYSSDCIDNAGNVAREEVFHCKLLEPVPRCFA